MEARGKAMAEQHGITQGVYIALGCLLVLAVLFGLPAVLLYLGWFFMMH